MKHYRIPALPRLSPIAAGVMAALATASTAAFGNPAAGAAIGPVFQANTVDNGCDVSPTIAMDAAGDFVVVWEDGDCYEGTVYAQRYTADGAPAGTVLTVSTTEGSQDSLDVAMDAAGDFVVVWENVAYNATEKAVYARRYSADGSPQSDEFQVNTNAANSGASPNVAMDAAGAFVVTWSRKGTGFDRDIYARRYGTDGNAQTDEFLINTTASEDHYSPKIAMDAAGDFVIGWQSYDFGPVEVIARRFDASGDALGDDFKISQNTNDSQPSPFDVSMDAAGNFIVAWTLNAVESFDGVIHAQRYGTDGQAKGVELKVSSSTGDQQSYPAVAMDASGGFIIAWENYNRVDKTWSVYAQRYDENGDVITKRSKLNTLAAQGGRRPRPAATQDAGGDVIVVWPQSNTSLGSDKILAQRFAREHALNISAGIALSPADAVVNPGSSLSLTATVTNNSDASTLSGNSTIDAGLNAASGITATITLPAGVSFLDASGSDWFCGEVVNQVLTCAYGNVLAAGEVSPAITVDVMAALTPAVMKFTNTVSGNQPDTVTANNIASAVDQNTDDAIPVAKAGSLAVNRNTAKNGTARSSDTDGDARTYSRITAPKHGTLTFKSTGSYTYKPNKNFTGKDSFTFKTSDGTLTSDAATVSITVTEHTPTATSASFSMTHNTSHSGTLKGSDTDTGDILTFGKVTSPKHGTLTLKSTGGYTYKPAANYKGTDKFTFHVSDGSKTSATATVSITVK